VKNGIFFGCDKGPFTYKGLRNYHFITCNKLIIYQLLIINVYVNDIIFHLDNMLIVDQHSTILSLVL